MSSSSKNSNYVLLPISINPLATALTAYTTIEIGFYLYYRWYMYPKGNALTTPQPYPGIYAKNRIALLERMLDRAERTCRFANRCILEYMKEYFELMIAADDEEVQDLICFAAKLHLNLGHLSTSNITDASTTGSSTASIGSTNSNSSSEENDDTTASSMTAGTSVTATTKKSLSSGTYSSRWFKLDNWVHPLIRKGDANLALAFGYFAKDYDDLEEWELAQVKEMHDICEHRFGITFREGRTEGFHCRRTSLDRIDTLHRPLSYYGLVKLVKTTGNNALRLFGFRRYKSKTAPLVCWHRPLSSSQYNSTDTNTTKLLPTLFFHGIAPAGLPLYIPMLLHGLFYEPDRPILLFETPYIASTLGFDNVITKQDTMVGVREILEQFPYTKNPHQPLSIIGHSFGTFVATWCIYDETLRQRIKSFILLDPVSILLSEPDVMNSFDNPGFLFWLLGTSELHVNHYVRRQFHWYTSELWLDDIPADCYNLIGLAHEDTIVNAPKVKREILTFTENLMANDKNDNKFEKQTRILYWHNACHGYCCLFPKVWKQIKSALMQQESLILKQQQEQQHQRQHQKTQ